MILTEHEGKDTLRGTPSLTIDMAGSAFIEITVATWESGSASQSLPGQAVAHPQVILINPAHGRSGELALGRGRGAMAVALACKPPIAGRRGGRPHRGRLVKRASNCHLGPDGAGAVIAHRLTKS
jgi:hypothetical protein